MKEDNNPQMTQRDADMGKNEKEYRSTWNFYLRESGKSADKNYKNKSVLINERVAYE